MLECGSIIGAMREQESNMRAFCRLLAVCLLMPTVGGSTVHALAGEAELAILSSYIGNWQGESALIGGDEPEPFRCRLARIRPIHWRARE